MAFYPIPPSQISVAWLVVNAIRNMIFVSMATLIYTASHQRKKTGEQCVLLPQPKQYCKALKAQRVSYHEGKGALLQFTNIHKQLKAPFVVYAEFECSLKVMTSIQALLRKRKSKTVSTTRSCLELVQDCTNRSSV